ncbi:NXPE family member 3 [Holothuria leucospilota]|uniref:NXPE family member 3 n=1 Tax=Holothuria leucospilota TaxID=206669 RepID=A0A9Q1GVF7_HOLLE|nr:NXPE family member 3 [Holothuria leucospilota]
MKEYLKLVIFVGVIVFFLAQIPSTETPRSLKLPPPKNVVVGTSYFANDLNLGTNASRSEEPTFYFDRCDLNNRDLFPTEISQSKLVKSFTKLGKLIENITSPDHTKVTVLNRKTKYSLCDRVIVKIEARDTLNRTKSYGGDIFRVKLFRKKPYAAVNADRFVDLNNGTYLAFFPILWEGYIDLQVMLVHPAEAIPLFAPTLNGSRAHMQTFLGGFESTDKNGNIHQESTICTITEREVEPFCNFSDTKTYVPWYCSAPRDEHLNCTHWTTHRTDMKGIKATLQTLIDKTGEELLRRSKTVVFRSNQLLVVPPQKKGVVQHYAQFRAGELPSCVRQGPPFLRTNGYFYDTEWFPFDCKIKKFTANDTLQCLKGKTIHFFGDSTSRQLYSFLKAQLNCKDIELEPPRLSSNFEKRCRIDNVTLHFSFHGLPIMGSTTNNVSGIKCASNEIDNIVGGPDYVIFLSLWAHFAMAGLDFYQKRIMSVKEAIQRLLVRSPGTTVLMKGANTRNYSVKQFILMSSDWEALQLEKTLRYLYKNDTFVGYIDTWDVTQVQPYADNIHPKAAVIANFVNNLLTYVCEDAVKARTK